MDSSVFRTILVFAVAIGSALVTPSSATENEVNVYSYREPDRIEPLLRSFHAATGIRVKTTFAPQGLIERIIGEGQKSPADVLLTDDFAPLLDARRRGLTQAFKSTVVEANVPAFCIAHDIAQQLLQFQSLFDPVDTVSFCG